MPASTDPFFSPVALDSMLDNTPHRAGVASATVIAVKDLLYKDESDELKPISDLPDAGSEPANQAAAAARIVGVSADASGTGDTEDVSFLDEGIFLFQCAATTFKEGDLVGPAESSGGVALETQVVKKVTQRDRAIGEVVQDYDTSTNRVRVRLRLQARGEGLGDLAQRAMAALNTIEVVENFTKVEADGTAYFELFGDSGTEAALDAQGGGASFATGNTDNNQTGLKSTGEAFLFNAKQEIAVAARLSVTEIDSGNLDSSWAFGLSSTDVDVMADDGSGPPSSYSGALFFKVETGTVVQAETSVGATQDTDADVGTYTGTGEVYDLLIHYVPIDATTGSCKFYLNGTLVHTSTITFSGATEMHAVAAIKTHGAQVETLKLFKLAIFARYSGAAA